MQQLEDSGAIIGGISPCDISPEGFEIFFNEITTDIESTFNGVNKASEWYSHNF